MKMPRSQKQVMKPPSAIISTDFEELLFWGRIEGIKNDYYIAMGVTYTDKFEVPEKRFYWATSADFKFKPFPTLND